MRIHMLKALCSEIGSISILFFSMASATLEGVLLKWEHGARIIVSIKIGISNSRVSIIMPKPNMRDGNGRRMCDWAMILEDPHGSLNLLQEQIGHSFFRMDFLNGEPFPII